MPDSSNQASSLQRRANWVALRTLRQLPRAVGETAGGKPVYEVRSVRLVLDGSETHFLRLSECYRCGRELTGARVLTQWDLDHPFEPMTCSDCIGSAGVSTGPEREGREPSGERQAPGHPAQRSVSHEVKPERIDAMEVYLRTVTDRVNELGRVARAHQAGVKERSQREESTAAALRDELALLRASTEESRADIQRVAEAQAALERRWAESPPADEAGGGLVQLRAEVAQLARVVEVQRGEVVEFVAAVGETQIATSNLSRTQDALAERLARIDLPEVEGLLATRLADAEGRLAHQIAGQWGDLETVIESSVKGHTAGALRANEALAGVQAVLKERIDALADQVTEACRRMEGVLDRLAAVEAAFGNAPRSAAEVAPARGFLDSLDRQLDAAARRLAARSAGAGRADQ